MILWSVAIRPFVPGFLPIEPCIPLLVLSLMLGPLRVVVPFILISGLLFDAFQPFPLPIAFYALILVALLVGVAVRFLLAGKSFYSALLLVIIARVTLAGSLFLLGPDAAIWSADRSVLLSPLFFLLTSLIDAILLLIGFRLVSRPLLGAHRTQIVR